jgi:hypothetical protein
MPLLAPALLHTVTEFRFSLQTSPQGKRRACTQHLTTAFCRPALKPDLLRNRTCCLRGAQPTTSISRSSTPCSAPSPAGQAWHRGRGRLRSAGQCSLTWRPCLVAPLQCARQAVKPSLCCCRWQNFGSTADQSGTAGRRCQRSRGQRCSWTQRGWGRGKGTPAGGRHGRQWRRCWQYSLGAEASEAVHRPGLPAPTRGFLRCAAAACMGQPRLAVQPTQRLGTCAAAPAHACPAAMSGPLPCLSQLSPLPCLPCSAAFPKRILILSPHPDDDVISMGGTLIRLIEQGHEAS